MLNLASRLKLEKNESVNREELGRSLVTTGEMGGWNRYCNVLV